MDLDLRAVAANIRRADTETLLDRATVYRPHMEPAALDLIEAELLRRGITAADLTLHDGERRDDALADDDGNVFRCDRCDRPAVRLVRDWYRVAGRLPVFPRRVRLCADHAPETDADAAVP